MCDKRRILIFLRFSERELQNIRNDPTGFLPGHGDLRQPALLYLYPAQKFGREVRQVADNERDEEVEGARDGGLSCVTPRSAQCQHFTHFVTRVGARGYVREVRGARVDVLRRRGLDDVDIITVTHAHKRKYGFIYNTTRL